MTDITPHRPRMLASFANHLIAVLDDLDHAQAALHALLEREHLDEHDLELLIGETGEARLDFSGERHGLLARLRRSVQKLTDEYEHARLYELELSSGHVLLVVHVHHEAQARRMCHLLRRYGGHFIHYYGPLLTESFCPDPEE